MHALVLLTVLASAPPADAASRAEARVVEYLSKTVRPGQPVVVSQLYNEVFKTKEERAALERLFEVFFKLPLFLAQHQQAVGRPPTLAEIAEQLRLNVPGEAELLLRIMEADPRMPHFLTRDPRTGELTQVDVPAILADPRFGRALDRTIAGWEGRPAPDFSATTYDGKPLSSRSLAGRPHLLYFWFTGCPPCVRLAPLLVKLQQGYGPRGLEIVALNADRTLGVPTSDEERAAYARKAGFTFTLAHASAETLEAYGGVSVFPSLFFIDRKGTIVRQLISFQELPTLAAAASRSLE